MQGSICLCDLQVNGKGLLHYNAGLAHNYINYRHLSSVQYYLRNTSTSVLRIHVHPHCMYVAKTECTEIYVTQCWSRQGLMACHLDGAVGGHNSCNHACIYF